MKTKVSLFILMLSMLSCFCIAQDTYKDDYTVNYTHNRKIDALQKDADKLDGKVDEQIALSDKEKTNKRLAKAFFGDINNFQVGLENPKKKIPNNTQVGMIRDMEAILFNYLTVCKKNKDLALHAPEVIPVIIKIVYSKLDSASVFNEVKDFPIEIIDQLNKHIVLTSDREQLAEISYRAKAKINPCSMLPGIEKYLHKDFAKDLIIQTAKSDPICVYNVISNKNSKLSQGIQKIDDPFVQTIIRIRNQPKPLLYYPFFDDIYKGKKTVEELSKVIGTNEEINDTLAYYNLLIDAEIEANYAKQQGQVVYGYDGENGLAKTLERKSFSHFTKWLNELHNMPDAIRYKGIQKLTPKQLYFVLVMTENEIYTSSYNYVYKLMMSRLSGTSPGDSLLLSVKFNRYKKFIKMAANFNKLEPFLASMNQGNAVLLMKQFCLLNNKKDIALEEATDIADSYSSIGNAKIKAQVLENIAINEAKASARANEDIRKIYEILNIICLSNDDPNKYDVTKLLGIEPIYTLKLDKLKDDSGRIVFQSFIYGDQDGKGLFPFYVDQFVANGFTKKTNKFWVELQNKKDKNLYSFINMPLDNDQNLDDTAQYKLIDHLIERDLKPSIIVHRGHSYWLPLTINKMPESGKIIMLGSCGGYKSLKTILKICPESHIISTKEIGKGRVNKVLIQLFNEYIIAKKDIDWKTFWKQFEMRVANKADMADYIPPYKNLGAIFIKAYQKAKGA